MDFLVRISQLLTAILSLFLALALSNLTAFAQKPVPAYKLSPVLAGKINSAPSTGTYLLRIMIAGKELPQQLKLAKLNARKIVEYDSVSFYLINASMKQLTDLILPLSKVLFVEDGTRLPKEETQVHNLDLGTNRINTVHHQFPQLNGDGLTISIKENKPDTTDIDFAGRYLTTTLSSPVTSDHATNMATMIAGGGNSWYLGKGAAWGAIISSSDYSSLLPDPAPVLKQYNIFVQNHSYGVNIENFYAPDAGAYDESIINNPSLLHIFSSGNSGTLASTTGNYAGVTGFANLTGSFKMAKNILTVGATDSFSRVAPQSSKGPAYDGRVKPELVAFGIDGSSGSAALVSGVLLMLQQQYKQLNGTLPANALIKAVLLNSADDEGNKEVDYSNGYGSLNALNSVNTLQLGRYMNGVVSNGVTQSFTLAVPAGIKKIKITLVWNDPPAAVNAVKALKNDLDLLLVNNATNENWKPWVLNPIPQVDSLQQPATRKRDSLNNVEQITLDNPAAGNYELTVKGYEVSDKQSFYIAYQFDSTDKFEWHFPTANDPVFSAAANTLRWNSSYPEAKGKLDYSIDSGSTWQIIDSAVDLPAGHYDWVTPAGIFPALLRMSVGANQFTSDTMVNASRTETGVGFNCADSFMIYWNKLPSITNYRLYELKTRYMEPFLVTTDSALILQKNAHSSLHYAVEPLTGGKEGLKSYTINYMLQGVECYIRSFLATLENNGAVLTLSLGSLYNINKIILEKFEGNSFKPVQQLLDNSNLELIFNDNNPSKGINRYRIKLEFGGGGIAYSLIESVFNFNGSAYVLYPNPAAQNQDINIAQQNVDIAIMQVYNAVGIKVFEKNLDDLINKVPSGKLGKGNYFINIINRNGSRETLKLVVY